MKGCDVLVENYGHPLIAYIFTHSVHNIGVCGTAMTARVVKTKKVKFFEKIRIGSR